MTSLGLKIGSILLIFYHVIYINRIVAVNNLAFGNPMYPGALYVLFLSLIPEIHPMDSLLIGNTFSILALYHLFQSVHRNQRSKRLFNAGFLIGVAALCNMNFLYVVPFYILVSNSMIVVRNRDFILYFLGFGVVIYILSAYWFLTDRFPEMFYLLKEYFHWFDFRFFDQEYGIIKTSLFAVLGLLTILVFRQVVSKTNIFVRNKLHFLFYFLLYSIGLVLVGFNVDLAQLQILFLPLALLFGLYLYNLSKPWIAEGIHLLIFIAAFLFQYFL